MEKRSKTNSTADVLTALTIAILFLVILLLVVQVVVGAVVYLPLAATWLWFTDRELLQSVIKPIKRILKKLHLAR